MSRWKRRGVVWRLPERRPFVVRSKTGMSPATQPPIEGRPASVSRRSSRVKGLGQADDDWARSSAPQRLGKPAKAEADRHHTIIRQPTAAGWCGVACASPSGEVEQQISSIQVWLRRPAGGAQAEQPSDAVDSEVQALVRDVSWSPDGGADVFVVDDVLGELGAGAQPVEASFQAVEVGGGEAGEDRVGVSWGGAPEPVVHGVDVEP